MPVPDSNPAPVRRRMPYGFGPMPSPRQMTDGHVWEDPVASIRAVTVSYLTDRLSLEALLPPGATLDGDPVVTVEFNFISNLQWLAGRGYNTLGVRFPVNVETPMGSFRGPFLSILWENLADPILTGREELGFAKLYCEIPPAYWVDGRAVNEARWDGHPFLQMQIGETCDAPSPSSTADGLLHYYAMPAIGRPGDNVSEGWVLTPPSPHTEILCHQSGSGDVRFLPATWQQLPTLAHIVNPLAALPIIEQRGATVTRLRSDTSLHNHRPLF